MRFALAAMWVLSCAREQHHDELLARFEEPALTVRLYEDSLAAPCPEPWLEKYKCLTRPRQRWGCVYLELGEMNPVPPKETPCLNRWRPVLIDYPVPVRFELDRAGNRFAWSALENRWSAGYLWNGQLVGRMEGLGNSRERFEHLESTGHRPAPTTGPVDWSTLPTFEEALDSFYFDTTGDPASLLGHLRGNGGDPRVMAILIHRPLVNTPIWNDAFESLLPEHQQAVADAVAEESYDVLGEAKLRWFEEHPQLRPLDFEYRAYLRAEEALADQDWELVENWLAHAYALHKPNAGAFACRYLEALGPPATWGVTLELRPEARQATAALAMIAATHTHCAAAAALAADPCDPLFRCGEDPGMRFAPRAFRSERPIGADGRSSCTVDDVITAIEQYNPRAYLDDQNAGALRVAAMMAQHSARFTWGALASCDLEAEGPEEPP